MDGARKHAIQALNDQRPFFNKIDLRTGGREQIGDGAYILRGRDLTWKGQLLATIDAVSSLSPFRHTVTPDGYTMSASIMNCVEHGAGSLTDADTGAPPDHHATRNPSPSMLGETPQGPISANSATILRRSSLNSFRAAFSLRAVQRYWHLPLSPRRRRNLNLVISFDAVRHV